MMDGQTREITFTSDGLALEGILHLAERRLRGISGGRSVLDLFAPVTRHEPLEASATPRRTGLAAAQ